MKDVEIPFIKMNGLGNDFVFVNQKHLPPNIDISKLSIHVCDRHLGIGCDNLIIYTSIEPSGNNSVMMSIYNIDGSKGKACGNASRCLTRLIYD